MPHPVPPLPARRALALAALAIVVAPASLPAQLRAAWEATATASRPLAGGALEDGRRLGALLRLDHPWVALTAEGAAEAGDRTTAARGSVAALVASPGWHGLRATLAGEARWSDGAAPFQLRPSLLGAAPGRWGAAREAGALEARLSWKRGAGGLWLGADAVGERGRPDGGALGGATGRGEAMRPNLGGWRQVGRAVASVSVGRRADRTAGRLATTRTEIRDTAVFIRTRDDSVGRWQRFTDTVEVRDPGTPGFLRRWTEVEGRLAWAHGRLAFDGRLGARPSLPGTRAAAWGGAHAAVALAPRLALVAGAGYEPTDVRRTTVPRRHASLGLRLTPAALLRPALPSAVRPAAAGVLGVRRLNPDEVLLALSVPGARTVEITGDFTNWRPVAMRAVGPDRWEATVRLAPGTHHLNMRVDGDAWVAPPGTTVVDDGFDGRVGLLVAP